MSFTLDQVTAALNAAADDIRERADLDDTGVIDALNLMVNVVGHRLAGKPDASIDDVIQAGYEATPNEVLSWFS